jgi:hypothetical protein
VRAELKSFFSPDINLDAQSGDTIQEDNILLTLLVGPAGGPGEETFDVTICTVNGLAELLSSTNSPVVGRHFLLVKTIQMDEIVPYLRRVISEAEAPTWSEVAQIIGRIGRWEYEDYVA